MTREEVEELKGLAASMGLYDDKNPCKRAVILGKAIKELEQKPCKDCIDREDALMCMTGEYVADVTCKPEDIISKHIQRLRVLPPVTPQQEARWISCSERLPAENITVIGTNEFDDIYKAELYDDCGEKKWYADGDYDVPIVAWMPLPEPYKEESEGV